MKLPVLLVVLFISLSVQAEDKFRYFVEWTALYSFNGNNHITKLQHQIGFDLKGSKCKICRESNPNEN